MHVYCKKKFGGVLASTWYWIYREHVERCACARKLKAQTISADANTTSENGFFSFVSALFAGLAGLGLARRREEFAVA